MKPNQILICAIAAIVLACLVIFGGHFVNAQGCTPGNMVVAGTNGDSSCGPAVPTLGLARTAHPTTDNTGFYAWTFPVACVNGGNVPEITAIAEGPNPQAGVNVNVQVEGTPSATAASFRVTKTTATVVALLGLTITVASTGTAVGTTVLDLTCAPQ